jgi:hypothetical protein
MKSSRVFTSRRFLAASLIVGFVSAFFFAWELNFLEPIGLKGLPRPDPTSSEMFLATAIVILLALNAGLYHWHRGHGSCPVGIKRTGGLAFGLSIAALICPVCTIGTVTFFGFVLSLSILLPFLPLFQVIAIILLCFGIFIMRPLKE